MVLDGASPLYGLVRRILGEWGEKSGRGTLTMLREGDKYTLIGVVVLREPVEEEVHEVLAGGDVEVHAEGRVVRACMRNLDMRTAHLALLASTIAALKPEDIGGLIRISLLRALAEEIYSSGPLARARLELLEREFKEANH